MIKSKNVRVWGKADNFDIELTFIGYTRDGTGELWQCEVSADVQDGQYACEIWAINEAGKTAYWTGILYMVNGVCHMEIHQSKYEIEIQQSKRRIEISSLVKRIEIVRGCPHAMW